MNKMIWVPILDLDAKFTYKPGYSLIKFSVGLDKNLMLFVNLQSYLKLFGSFDTKNMLSNLVNFDHHPKDKDIWLTVWNE